MLQRVRREHCPAPCVQARTSMKRLISQKGCCSPAATPRSMGRCRRRTTRSKTPPTRPYATCCAITAECVRHGGSKQSSGGALHAHRKPASTSTTLQDHARRHPDRSRMGTRLTSSPRRWRHPPLGQRHRLARTPPHQPPPKRLRLTSDQHLSSFNPVPAPISSP